MLLLISAVKNETLPCLTEWLYQLKSMPLKILKTAKNLTLCKKFPLIRVSFRIGIKAEAGTVKIVNL